MKFSFLICAYNADKYLKECIDSLVNQDFDKKDYEIILVNDGSTDKTEEIARAYKNVKIVNQVNVGLPGARNTAMENSIGKWMLFVDADDYVSLDYLKEVNKAIESNVDCNFIQIYEKKEKEAAKKDKKIQLNKLDDSIVSRAFKRDLVKEYKFPGEYKFAIEDWDFYVHNYHKLKSVNITNNKNTYYFYRYTEGSLSKTNNIYKSRFEHAISIFEDPKLRKLNLEQGIVGHYWEHLYMVARLWHPELMPRVKAIKYKTKVKLSLKIQYWIVRMGLLNWVIKKVGNPIKK